MIQRVLNIILVMFIIFLTPLSFCAEGGGAVESGAGATGAHGERNTVKADKKLAELMGLQNEIQSLESGVRSKKENLMKLVEEKQHTSDPTQSRELIKSIEKEYKDFRESAERLERKQTQMRFRFPEKGSAGKKENDGDASLKAMELESSADSESIQVMSLMRKKYNKKIDTTPKQIEKAHKSPTPHGDDLDSVITIKK